MTDMLVDSFAKGVKIFTAIFLYAIYAFYIS